VNLSGVDVTFPACFVEIHVLVVQLAQQDRRVPGIGPATFDIKNLATLRCRETRNHANASP